MALVLSSGPAVEPVSATETKLHLRVDHSDDDDLIDGLIQAAREYVEHASRWKLITQTWTYTMDRWPSADRFTVPVSPLQSISSITYKDEDGNSSTLSSAAYIVDTSRKPGQVVLATDQSWPSGDLYPVNAITVTAVAGFGAAGSSVPQHLRQAILLLIGHWYENRESVVVTPGVVAVNVPMAVDALIRLDRGGW